ncbi:MAG: hypothetical protein R3B70_09525 [Polyangiaceae bacterium]
MRTPLAAAPTLLLPLLVAALVAAPGCNADPPRKPAPSTTSAVAEGLAIKDLTAPKSTAPLKIDGVLDEEAWSKAAATGLFVDVATGLPDPQIQGQGEAKIFGTITTSTSPLKSTTRPSAAASARRQRPSPLGARHRRDHDRPRG